MIGPACNAIKSCARKGHPGIIEAIEALKTWRDDEGAQTVVRATVGDKLRRDCRDLTRNVVNLVKGLEYSATIDGLEDRDVKTLPKMAKPLVYGDANCGNDITDAQDAREIAKIIRMVRANALLFDKIASRIP